MSQQCTPTSHRNSVGCLGVLMYNGVKNMGSSTDFLLAVQYTGFIFKASLVWEQLELVYLALRSGAVVLLLVAVVCVWGHSKAGLGYFLGGNEHKGYSVSSALTTLGLPILALNWSAVTASRNKFMKNNTQGMGECSSFPFSQIWKGWYGPQRVTLLIRSEVLFLQHFKALCNTLRWHFLPLYGYSTSIWVSPGLGRLTACTVQSYDLLSQVVGVETHGVDVSIPRPWWWGQSVFMHMGENNS